MGEGKEEGENGEPEKERGRESVAGTCAISQLPTLLLYFLLFLFFISHLLYPPFFPFSFYPILFPFISTTHTVFPYSGQ